MANFIDKIKDKIGNIIYPITLTKAVYREGTSKTVEDLLKSKVDKISGKQLSSNDFTDKDKLKLDNAINKTGGIFTGQFKILGQAAEDPLKVRGIQGIDSDGQKNSELFLNYNNQLPVYINGFNKAWHSGNDGKDSGLDADMVDGHHINQGVGTDDSPTFASVNTPSLENFKINGSLINKVIAPSSTQIAQSPVSGFLWHDTLAFCKIGIPSFEKSPDGNTWVPTTLDKKLFMHKEDQAITCLESSNTKAVRWTWNSSDISWNNAQWLILGFTWVSNAPNVTVVVQTGRDGNNWVERHRSTGSYSSNPYWFYLAGHGGDRYLRITIIYNSGDNVRLSSMRLLTTRWGDQGKGSELKYPYTWNEDQFMFVNTPPDNSNSNLIATTAFVKNVVKNTGAGNKNVISKTKPLNVLGGDVWYKEL